MTMMIIKLTAAAVSASFVKFSPLVGLLHRVSLQVHRVPDHMIRQGLKSTSHRIHLLGVVLFR